MRPETFRVGNGIFLPDITFFNVNSCCDPARKKNELEHVPHIHRTAVLVFRLGILQLTLPVLHTSSTRARRFAFVVRISALGKLGHMQPEWFHHRRNSVKHLSLLPLLVPRKDLSAERAYIAQYLLLAAPPSLTFMSLLSSPSGFILNTHWGKFCVFANLFFLFMYLCGLMLVIQIQE